MIRRRLILLCCSNEDKNDNNKKRSWFAKFNINFLFKKTKNKEEKKIENEIIKEETLNDVTNNTMENDENVLQDYNENLGEIKISEKQPQQKKPFYKSIYFYVFVIIVAIFIPILLFRLFIAPILNQDIGQNKHKTENQIHNKNITTPELNNSSDIDIPINNNDNDEIIEQSSSNNIKKSVLDNEKLFKKRCIAFAKKNNILIGLNNQIYINDNIYAVSDELNSLGDNVIISGIKFSKPNEINIILSNGNYKCNIPVDPFKNFKITPYIEAINIKELNSGKSLDYIIGDKITFGIKLKDIKDDGIVIFSTPAGVYVYKKD